MVKEYRVYGLHCKNCSNKLAEELISLPNSDQIYYDKEARKLIITEKNDYENVKLKVSANGAYLVPEHMINQHDDKNDDDHHSHSHVSTEDEPTRNIGIAFFLNLIFSVAEFIFGSLFNSFAIMTDAVHDLGDALSIGVSWILQKISTKEPDSKFSDGYGRFSLLGSLFTGLVLIGGSIMMIIRSIPRLSNPEPVNYNGMLWLAIVAIAINVYAGYLMNKGNTKNEKMLSYHMLEDVLGWMAVLVVSFILRFVDWYILDPILSVLIATFILYKTIPVLLSSAKVFMNVVPENMDVIELRQRILDLNHVHGISNLHTYSIDGVNNIFSVTLFVDTNEGQQIEDIKDHVRLLLVDYKVVNTTIEVIPDVGRIVV